MKSLVLKESSAIPILEVMEVSEPTLSSGEVLACLIACPIGVALRALHDVARVKEGDDVVIFGIGGGLGIHLAQIAAAAGANVLGFTTHKKKLEKMVSIGFEQVFLHQDGVDPSDLVMAFTEDKGADIVVNPVGSAVFTSGLRSLANNGCMVLLGEIKGESVAVNPAEIIFRDVSIVGCKGADMHHIETAIRMVSMGNIKPIIDSVFSFDEVLIAYDRVKSGLSLGRVVLVP